MNDEIRRALIEVHDDDLKVIRQYISWVRIRRRITDRFYTKYHWVGPSSGRAPAPAFHWVG